MNFYIFILLLIIFTTSKLIEVGLRESSWKYILSDILIFFVTLIVYIFLDSFNHYPSLIFINSLIGIILIYTCLSSLGSLFGISNDLEIVDFITLGIINIGLFLKNMI